MVVEDFSYIWTDSFVMCDELQKLQVREKDCQTRLDKANNVLGKLKPVYFMANKFDLI